MKKAIALLLMMIAVSACTVSCETVGRGTSIDTVTGYEAES